MTVSTSFHCCLASLVLLLVSFTQLPAQGTRADYERARELRRRTENTVYRDRVRAHWLPGDTQFWYRVDTRADHYEFVLIDAEERTREPAFDHARMAASLRSEGVEAEAGQLPIDRLDFGTPGQLVFRSDRRWWSCSLEDYALQETEAKQVPTAGRAPSAGPRASRRTGPETEITFVNQMDEPIELFWLNSSGQRRSYGKIAAGKRRSQHTFSGHVWLAVDSGGDELVVFIAEDDSFVAEVAGRVTADPTENRPRRRRSSAHHVSPDGRWRVSVADHNVLLRDLLSEEQFALTTDGTEEDGYDDRFSWSPDSRKLVVVRTRAGEEHKVHFVESAPQGQLQPKLHSFDYRKPGDQIPHDRPQLFHVETRKRIDVDDALFPRPWSIREIRWSPDSTEWTFVYNQRGHQVLRIIGVNADSGQTRTIIDEQSETFIDYAYKQYTHYLDDAHEIVWMSERDGWNHLYLYDTTTGEVKNQITRGPWIVRDVERVDAENRQIWFTAGGIRPDQDPYYEHSCRVNFDGSGLVILTEGNGTHEVEFSPDRRFLIDRWSRVNAPPTTELRDADDGRLICTLEKADADALRKTGWVAPEPFVAKGRDGETDIYGVIFRPTGFDPGRQYPVIEEIYAGPQGAFVPKSFRTHHKAQAVAELGFIVVKIDGMGTSHRSKRFHDVCWKNLGDSGFPDRILWIQAAARRYPAMDTSRVGIYGGSAGGQSALRALLAHGDFYKVAVADCGCHDNRMDKIWWNELWMGWPIGPHYEEQSNVTQAHRLEGKLMLVVGENDRNVDPASTLQVVDALVKADKDFDLVLLPGTGHGAAETPYGNRRRQDFLVRHLLHVEPRHEPAGVGE